MASVHLAQISIRLPEFTAGNRNHRSSAAFNAKRRPISDSFAATSAESSLEAPRSPKLTRNHWSIQTSTNSFPSNVLINYVRIIGQLISSVVITYPIKLEVVCSNLRLITYNVEYKVRIQFVTTINCIIVKELWFYTPIFTEFILLFCLIKLN